MCRVGDVYEDEEKEKEFLIVKRISNSSRLSTSFDGSDLEYTIQYRGEDDTYRREQSHIEDDRAENQPKNNILRSSSPRTDAKPVSRDEYRDKVPERLLRRWVEGEL